MTPQNSESNFKPGDPNWLAAHAELVALHVRKSATYGTVGEPLLNFVEIGLATGRPPERYVWERLLEKTIRALNMIDAGLENDVVEAMDASSLALCAEALRRRRL